MSKVENETIYRNHDGNEYEVILITNRNSDSEKYPITVVYKGWNGEVWSKPMDDFLQKMTFVRNKWCCERAKSCNGWHHNDNCPERPDFCY